MSGLNSSVVCPMDPCPSFFFIIPISDSLFQCGICCDYLNDPRETNCCHSLFCVEVSSLLSPISFPPPHLHLQCFKMWTAGNNTCPNCRARNPNTKENIPVHVWLYYFLFIYLFIFLTSILMFCIFFLRDLLSQCLCVVPTKWKDASRTWPDQSLKLTKKIACIHLFSLLLFPTLSPHLSLQRYRPEKFAEQRKKKIQRIMNDLSSYQKLNRLNNRFPNLPTPPSSPLSFFFPSISHLPPLIFSLFQRALKEVISLAKKLMEEMAFPEALVASELAGCPKEMQKFCDRVRSWPEMERNATFLLFGKVRLLFEFRFEISY